MMSELTLYTPGLKGRMRRYYTVWCGCCAQWHGLEANKWPRVAQEARDAGWRYTRRYGWLCPDCAKKLEAE